MLAAHSMQFVALSSGDLDVDAPDAAAAVAHHVSNCRFLRDAGGMYLQIIDKKPKHTPTAADYKRLGQMLTELGKQTADLGVPLGYHNHMGAMGQTPEDVDRVMDAADPRYVKLELDIAHYFEGGGDPAKAIVKYSDRLLFLHLKDVKPLAAAAGVKRDYQFAELGQGNVDLSAVLKALNHVKFRGWAIVELDGLTDGTHTPKQSAEVSKEYLERRGSRYELAVPSGGDQRRDLAGLSTCACAVVARDFGLQWIEIRGMWNKNIPNLDASDVDARAKILEKYKLRVTDIASPLFKVRLAGRAAHRKKVRSATSFMPTSILTAGRGARSRCIALAKAFQTDRVRCFDFWRLEDQRHIAPR